MGSAEDPPFKGLDHIVGGAMSDRDSDRFRGVDQAIERVREEFDEAIDESREAGTAARREVQEAIDDLEERLRDLRDRV